MNRILRRQIKDYMKTFFRPPDLEVVPELMEPTGERVMVWSPHFDDDVFGCGGTLARHHAAGARTTVVYFTDGREGDPSCPDRELVEVTRKQEATRAAALLGVTEVLFLDQPESRLRPTGTLVRRLADLVADRHPDTLYVPSVLENHVDHFEMSRIFLRVAKTTALSCHVRAYEVWTPLLPNVLVDITDVVSTKRQAAEQHMSQLKHVDYVNTILALNRYRSIATMQGRGYAEAFLAMSAPRYAALLQDVGVPPRFPLDRRLLELTRTVRARLTPRCPQWGRARNAVVGTSLD